MIVTVAVVNKIDSEPFYFGFRNWLTCFILSIILSCVKPIWRCKRV